MADVATRSLQLRDRFDSVTSLGGVSALEDPYIKSISDLQKLKRMDLLLSAFDQIVEVLPPVIDPAMCKTSPCTSSVLRAIVWPRTISFPELSTAFFFCEVGGLDRCKQTRASMKELRWVQTPKGSDLVSMRF